VDERVDKIKVLIVDDSALIRTMLSSIFENSGVIEVVGTAADPIIARAKIKKYNPDVITLDIEMPRMDGITFLRNLMRLRPMPVLMISSLTAKGAQITLDALEIGAIDFIEKPKSNIREELLAYEEDIIEKISMAASVDFNKQASKSMMDKTKKINTLASKDDVLKNSFPRTEKIIVIGSSTGGTEAVKTLVADLPNTTPAILITQHLPIAFSESFTKHVNEVTAMDAVLAEDGMEIKTGCIYIAPGDRHLYLVRKGSRYYCKLNNGDLVNRHKPSVEVLFRSAAKHAGNNAIGVMLTGMGSDGATGMKVMRDNGAANIVQDESSSVVWGMPRAAYEIGAAHYMEPLNKIAKRILTLANT